MEGVGAGALPYIGPGVNAVGAQILADSVPPETCAPRDLADREILPTAPASDNAP